MKQHKPLRSYPHNSLMAGLLLCALGGAGLVACGKGPKAPRPSDQFPTSKPMDLAGSGPAAGDDDEAEESKFDESEATKILKRGARQAAHCGDTTNVPAGEGEVTVTFDGAKGRTTEVALPPLWSDLQGNALSCMENSFLNAIVPLFEGVEKRSIKVVIEAAGGGGGGDAAE